MTPEFLHGIRDNNTLTRTSIPNHTRHRKDMKYDTHGYNSPHILLRSIRMPWILKLNNVN